MSRMTDAEPQYQHPALRGQALKEAPALSQRKPLSPNCLRGIPGMFKAVADDRIFQTGNRGT